MATARQDKTGHHDSPWAPANLNKEGRGWKEVSGEGRHDWAQVQHRHSLRWCGMGQEGFTLRIKR